MPKQLKQYEKVLKAIQLSEVCCPYPSDVFTPLSSHEINEVRCAMDKTGISLDRLSAHLMRVAWENSHKIMRIKIKDEFEY